ncbi:putative LOC107373683-like protein [Nothobranchius furzeri]|uniref:LOC107373683-like protein n=1 Tax=Nothobranchius furzeri TaxID=105023 RepID=A0A9D2XAN5_NOTFU|nr:putative LOC107373683-like protein [Nothobranchius furzeri]
MLFSVLLLLLLVCGTDAGFHGFVYMYTSKSAAGNGYLVVKHAKMSYSACYEVDQWFCGSCAGNTYDTIPESEESTGNWCQRDKIWGGFGTSYSSSSASWGGVNWLPNTNGVTKWKAVLYNEMRKRSDVNKPNSTPQTTTIPTIRIPSNCPRNISLLKFDPDKDEVRCRHAVSSSGECYTCTPPSILSLSSSCSLSFNPTSSSDEGAYAVQLMMEDFPRQTITLTDSSNLEETKTPSDFISKIPVQFLVRVYSAIPSCIEGLYLPRFLPPTPENGAQIYADVNQLLEITIRAEATLSTITDLLVSRPYNMAKSTSGSGNFTLRWTPSESQANESHPICFIVETRYSGFLHQSEHRCVIVTVRTLHIFYLKMKISTTLSLVNDKEIIEEAIKDELVRRGIPLIVRVRLLGGDLVEVRTIPHTSD